jgi:hypothetical protein
MAYNFANRLTILFIGEFCETFVVDRPYIIRSNQVFVIFQSDDRVERIGFKIKWSAVDNATNEIGVFCSSNNLLFILRTSQ